MVLLTKGKLYNTGLAHENCSYCRNDEDVDHVFLKVPVFKLLQCVEFAFKNLLASYECCSLIKLGNEAQKWK